jgi:uncharacterized repeat protein (TIGR02543 family)
METMKKIRMDKGIRRSIGAGALFFLIVILAGIGIAGCESPLLEEIRVATEEAQNPTTYTVTFHGQGADVEAEPPSITITVPSTTIDSLPIEPQKAGYYFAGWFFEPEGGGNQFYASTLISSSFTVFAKWNDLPTHTVSFDVDGGSHVEPQYIQQHSTVTQPDDPEKTGYTFSGWYKEATFENVWDFDNDTVEESITIFAKWIGNSYSVEFDMRGGEGDDTTVSVTYGDPMPPATAPTKTGYTFAGYYTELNGEGTQYYTASMTSAHNWNITDDTTTLYANWNANSYKVTFDLQEGTGDINEVSAEFGSPMPSAATPTRTGYTFHGYFEDEGGLGKQYYTETMGSASDWDIAEDTTLYAYWTVNSYLILCRAC